MPPQKTILVVDGDRGWRARLVDSMAPLLCRLAEADAGREALDLALDEPPDLLITELLLPDISGLGLCRLVRESRVLREIGILMVSSYSDEIDRVLAFETGVDDFLPKPFSGRELCSRANAILRRVHDPRRGGGGGSSGADSRDRTLDEEVRAVRVETQESGMTRREAEVLAVLVEGAGRVMTRDQLLERVWGEDGGASERVVDAHVKAIRRKLGSAKHRLETVRGIGYRFLGAPPR